MSDRQLDIEVALFVMGQKYAGPCPLGAEDCPGVYEPKIDAPTPCLPRYSTDISAAWKVVEKMHERGRECVVDGVSRLGWYVTVWASDFDCAGEAEAETAPLAICRAALAAVRAAKGERQG